MAKDKKAKTVDKWKKKKWFTLIAPEMFKSQVLGEIPLDDVTKVQDRTITSNLMTLTGDMKKKNISIKFAINDVKESKGYTRITSYNVASSSLKRMVRKGKDRLDESFIIKTKDGVFARIKIMVLTHSNTSRSVHTALKNELIYLTKTKALNTNFEEMFNVIMYAGLQKEIKKTIDKIYPIRTVEVRSLSESKSSKLYTEPKEKPKVETDSVDAPKKTLRKPTTKSKESKKVEETPEEVDETTEEETEVEEKSK